MVKAFASEQNAIGICDRCGWEYPLKELRKERINLNISNLRVCPSCWDPDHPQNRLGRRTYGDAQALRDPRVDTSVTASRYGDSVRYDFAASDESWNASVQATSGWSDTNGGEVLFTTTGSNGSLHRTKSATAISIDTSTYKIIRARIRSIAETVQTDWIGRVQWRRTTDISYSLSSRIAQLPRPKFEQFGDQWHILTWNLRNDSNWSGTVDSVQFTPYSTSGNQLGFDYIRFESA